MSSPFKEIADSGLPSGVIQSFKSRLESAEALGQSQDWYRLATWVSGLISGLTYCPGVDQAQLDLLGRAHSEALGRARRASLRAI